MNGVCAGCGSFPAQLGELHRCESCRTLYAAAPDLLAVLQEFEHGANEYVDNADIPVADVLAWIADQAVKARAAIRKAEEEMRCES